MNRTRIAAAIVLAAALAGSLAGCGGGPSEQACKAAMKQQYATALESGTQARGEPAACKGLPDSVLRRLAGEVLAGN